MIKFFLIFFIELQNYTNNGTLVGPWYKHFKNRLLFLSVTIYLSVLPVLLRQQ